LSKYRNYSKEQLILHIEKLEKQLKSTKYGLYWDKEIEPEFTIEYSKKNIPILQRIRNLTIKEKDNDLNHLIIEGDNFHVLTTLNMISNGQGFVDVVYIDPPYNTGNKDFIYNDNFIDKDDGFRHSKWLNFMEKRLMLAKSLMKEDGTIFISIDDNEYFNLKLLCDKIWGEHNYVGSFVRKTVSQRAMSKYFNNQHEYCLIYTNNKDLFPLIGRKKDFSGYKNPDNDPKGDWKSSDPTMRDSKNIFKIINPITNKVDIPPAGRGWAFTEEKLQEHLESGKIVFKEKHRKNERGFIYKTYKSELKSHNLLLNSLEFAENAYLNQVSSKELINIFNKKTFDYAKPLNYIKDLISFFPNKGTPVILDFFAGSGTTGQSVLELNQEDGGNRQFILVTNNENNICTDVTYPRLKTVISGIRPDGTKYSDGISANLHYYKTDFIPNVNNRDQAKYNIVERCNELMCIVENTYNELENNEKYSIYENNSKTKRMFLYTDFYEEKSFNEFKSKVLESSAEVVVYIFSTDNVIDETLFDKDSKVQVKPIPNKIYEIYKEIIEGIKRG